MKKSKIIKVGATLIACFSLAGCSFNSQANPTTLVPSCSLDSIFGAVQDSTGNYSISLTPPDMVLNGWLANSATGMSPEEIMVVLTDNSGEIPKFKSGQTFNRPDVAKAYNKPGMEKSGFSILLENVKVAGTYFVTMQGSFSGKTSVCTRSYTLTVAP